MSAEISVIFAAHNEAQGLRNALDSIKNQTFKNFEVIMIDALSTDESAKIMKSYCSDKRFSFFELSENSISAARNLGLEKAQGKYVAFSGANVIFTKNLLAGMFESSERADADLCVAKMASSDIYGKHEFASTGILLKRKRTTKFDTDLIWNPSVTNKLFLRKRIEELNLRFSSFGKAREAAFSIPFAFESNVIVCSSKGAASFIIPVSNEGAAQFPIEHYLDAYRLIMKKAEKAFENEKASASSDFDRKELEYLRVCYLDQVLLKEITVLLYSYYRHFWTLEESEIKKYSEIISSLIEGLSKSGKKALFEKNRDIFFSGKLLSSKKEMAENPRVTVCIGKSERHGHLHEQRLKIQVESIFNQTMPCFELLVDKRLEDIFPPEWKNMPNVRFLEASCLGEFKDTALEESKTDYIMYQDGFARLNPKILMRHYCALSTREKYGFSTSPLTCFNGEITREYSFSDIAFFSNMEQTVTALEDNTFSLDLFFCNKLFRKEYLEGIHFSFTDEPVVDMYKIYLHSRFKKLSHRGAYLPYTEEEAIGYLKEEQDFLPPECKKLYRNYRSIYFRKVTLVKRRKAVKRVAENFKKRLFNLLSKIYIFFFAHAKLHDRVLFYSVRSNGALIENIRSVYDAFDGKKVCFAKKSPHSVREAARAVRLILTSKVVVTDGYVEYLRRVRLRPEQSVVQIWHAGGAFRRFGLDSPTTLSRFDEYKTHSQYTDVCVSSEYVRQFYAHAFGVDLEIVRPLGCPRTDIILDSERRKEERELICSKHPLLKDKKVYIYFPTYREEDGQITFFDPKIDWFRLNDELADDEVFVVSRHPLMKNEFFKGLFFSRVKDYTFEPTGELLSVADAIVTDYSSIIFDASLLNLPMVFYCPDFDNYERDFYLDFEKDIPGNIIKDESQLLSSVRASLTVDEGQKLADFKEKQMGACDGNSTERVVSLIEERLKKTAK